MANNANILAYNILSANSLNMSNCPFIVSISLFFHNGNTTLLSIYVPQSIIHVRDSKEFFLLSLYIYNKKPIMGI